MNARLLHRLAVLLCLCIFFVIAAGALLTSEIRPLPGTPVAAAATSTVNSMVSLARIHDILAGIAAVLALGLAVAGSPALRLPAWIAAGLTAIDILLGIHSGGGMLPAFAGVVHAVLAPVLFSTAVTVAVITSKSWQMPPVPAQDLWPPLLKLAFIVPLCILLQIMLGAAFRHNSIGVIWHILNAMVVLMLILVWGICVIRQYPEHPALRPAAVTLMVITGIQVALGFAAYLILLIVDENNMALIITSVLHILNGSLTLAASAMLAVELRRARVAETSHGSH
jgi:heme A synthase